MTDATGTALRRSGVETDRLLQRLRSSNTTRELCGEAADEIERMSDLIARVLHGQPEILGPPPPDAVVDAAVSAAATEAVQLARALRLALPFVEDRGLARLNGIGRDDVVAMGRRALGDQQDH